jgi:hypothetical protein
MTIATAIGSVDAAEVNAPATRITDANSKDNTFVRTQSIVTPFVQLGVGL